MSKEKYENKHKLFVFVLVLTIFKTSFNKNIKENKKNDLTFNKPEFSKLNDQNLNLKNYRILLQIKEKMSNFESFTETNFKENIIDIFQPEYSSHNLQHFKIFILGEKCSKMNCENQNGSCLKNNYCLCDLGYANLQESKIACNFKESFQIYALILELVFPIGIGHFYCSRNLVGFIKLISLFLIPLFIVIIFNLLSKMKKETIIQSGYEEKDSRESVNLIIIKKIFFFVYSMIFFIWFLFDIVMFASNFHKDGWGYDLIKI